MKHITTLTAFGLIAGLSFAGCGGTTASSAQQAGRGLYNPTALQDTIVANSAGRDPLSSAVCVLTGPQRAKCGVVDTSGANIVLTVKITLDGSHSLVTGVTPNGQFP